MTYCKYCGKEVESHAFVCVHCGGKLKEEKPTTVDNPSHLAGIVSCCFPIVGVILYFLWREEKPESAKLVCHWMLAGLGIWFLFYLYGFLLTAFSVRL
ncbi:zinc ribbon domain-containing protein [Anaerobranca gottschalkii]|uniref:Zinc-ribbon domain-containing protein n=1 Tax=Anaerobranca gottschalkii DSM 13577 TaxID=1120990 RepID=A0A1I0BXP4_9FIRM|nr:zinc ribbon domain-containing protein [Anaerobranca gottschalkii]SET11887.1 hypothetical protein SAMN03080614_105113 [Anaerobranca gottschalkii DSM 13577]